MSIASELVAPITVDLRAEDNTFNIIKGIEHVNYMDLVIDTAAQNLLPGLWVMKTSTGCVLPTSDGLANVYPVIVGNNEYDSLAIGSVTVGVGGGWLYKTTQFTAASYSIGDNLMIAGTTGKLVAQTSTNAIVARVWAYDSVKAIMTVLVLNR